MVLQENAGIKIRQG